MPKPRRRRNRKKKKGKKQVEKKEEETPLAEKSSKKKKGIELGKPNPKFKPNKELIAKLRRNEKRMAKRGFKPKKRKTGFSNRSRGKKDGNTRENQIEAKLNMAMKQLQGQEIGDVDEVKIFRKNAKTIEFENPKVTAAMNSNTYLIVGERKSGKKAQQQQQQQQQGEREELVEIDDDDEKDEKDDQKIEEIKDDDDEEDVILPAVDSFDTE